MKYGKIENGQVRQYNQNQLPENLDNIISFKNSSIETKNSKGFYEIVFATIGANQRAETILPTDLIGTQFIQRVYNFSQAEIDAEKSQQLVNLKEDYSQRITDIPGLREALERFAMDGEPIPLNIIEERAQLIAQYEIEKAAL